MSSKTTTTAPFIIFRAILAIVLMIGFYILAIGIAGLLAWLPIAEIKYAHNLHIKLAIFGFFSAGVILWSILPRFDKFDAPGPKLVPADHPKFFKSLNEIAARTGQAPPAEVYLCPDVNAWVTQRGGLMGFGSRRVMGVGLPLLQIFTVSEFNAVLAHEFGHYHGGDTKLGPWIYKTRGMIVRTLYGLGNSIVQKPFLCYGKMFLRITHAISRRQEYLADELAARTVSAQALISGLKKVHGASMGYRSYLQNEYGPVFESGVRAPFCEGFQRFLLSPKVSEALTKGIDEEIKQGKSDPYDTHPALKDRIAALENLGLANSSLDDTAGISLIEHPENYEPALLKALSGNDKVVNFTRVSWEDVGTKVYVPLCRKTAMRHPELFKGRKLENIYAMAKNPELLKTELLGAGAHTATAEDLKLVTMNVMGAALAFTLAKAGWQVEAKVGEPILLMKDGVIWAVFEWIEQVVDGNMSKTQWDEKMQAANELLIDLA